MELEVSKLQVQTRLSVLAQAWGATANEQRVQASETQLAAGFILLFLRRQTITFFFQFCSTYSHGKKQYCWLSSQVSQHLCDQTPGHSSNRHEASLARAYHWKWTFSHPRCSSSTWSSCHYHTGWLHLPNPWPSGGRTGLCTGLSVHPHDEVIFCCLYLKL